VLYKPYPEDWPEYTPKDKMGDWLDEYAAVLDLPIWTASTIATPPSYDQQNKRWTVHINHSDFEGNTKIIELRPTHIVLATGTLGPPRIPSFPGTDLFTSTNKIIHSSDYKNPASLPLPYFPDNKRKVLIIGTGNTAADFALDLSQKPIAVTMLQRSPTCVAFPGALNGYWQFAHPPGVGIDDADFRLNAVPRALRTSLIKDYMKAVEEGKVQRVEDSGDARRRAMLEGGGFRIWDGEDGLGVLGDVNERFSGMSVPFKFSAASLTSSFIIRISCVHMSHALELVADILTQCPTLACSQAHSQKAGLPSKQGRSHASQIPAWC
jgi:hypothetical protein